MNQTFSTLEEWVAREAIPFSLESAVSMDAAIDRVIGGLKNRVELLGLGEPLHGDETFLLLRNRLFQRLVEAHGFAAIAIESSFPRAHAVNEYVAGSGAATYEELQEVGFSHGFGRSEANRELVEWMRSYNADLGRAVKLRFYGFDSPTEMMTTDSPWRVLGFVLDYLTSVDADHGQDFRDRVESLIGEDAAWENTEAAFDPGKSIGLSPAANALRLEIEELISELNVRRPEFVATSGVDDFLEALHYASIARQLMTYHATVARESDRRIVQLLGIRDAMMASNLAYIVARERGRGRVLAFAHNMHLQRGRARWQWGPGLMEWWPAGAHLDSILGPQYAVIGSGIGAASESQGIAAPEADTIESILISEPGAACFIPTQHGDRLPSTQFTSLPTRSGSAKNSSYFPLGPQSFTDFDWLLIVN
jgi:erythromycin esterase